IPSSKARATARSRSAGAPRTIRPPTSPHPKASADTLSPVLPSVRYSIEVVMPDTLHQVAQLPPASAGLAFFPAPGRSVAIVGAGIAPRVRGILVDADVHPVLAGVERVQRVGAGTINLLEAAGQSAIERVAEAGEVRLGRELERLAIEAQLHGDVGLHAPEEERENRRHGQHEPPWSPRHRKSPRVVGAILLLSVLDRNTPCPRKSPAPPPLRRSSVRCVSSSTCGPTRSPPLPGRGSTSSRSSPPTTSSVPSAMRSERRAASRSCRGSSRAP